MNRSTNGLELALTILAEPNEEYTFGCIHKDLRGRILEVERMCEAASGHLRSRQVVAAIIEQWDRDNPDLVTYGETNLSPSERLDYED